MSSQVVSPQIVSPEASVPASAPSGSKSAATPEVAVIVPTFNEAGNVAAVVAAVDTALAGFRWELIFVDDASPDGTAERVREIARSDGRIRCIERYGRRGLSGACIEGLLSSSAGILMVMDGDLQHDARTLAVMARHIQRNEADVVVASRYVGAGSDGSFSASRRRISHLSASAARLVTGVSVSDPMSGFFALSRTALREVAPNLASEGFKILLDLLSARDKSKPAFRVVEVPYSFGTRQSGESKLGLRVAMDFVGLLVSKATGGVVPIRFINFVAVGALGVAVHLVALQVLRSLGVEFVPAQTAATFVAMTSNFAFNNALTYGDKRLTGTAAIKALFLFYVICGIGALSNIGVAAWLYAQSPSWWVAGVIGSVIGAVWNYALSSRLIWRT